MTAEPALGAERRAPSAERRAPSAERRAPSAERRAPSAERRAPSAERRAPSAERRAPSAERRAPSAERGFTLIELLIVVAIIGIIAAIAIPSLLRARVSANESAAIGDIRALVSAEYAFQSVAFGLFGAITCLTKPSGCISNYPPAAPNFLNANVTTLIPRSGYTWDFLLGPFVVHPNLLAPGGVSGYCYQATPLNQNQTGVRGFGGDHSGRICTDPAGATVCNPTGSLPATCTDLQ